MNKESNPTKETADGFWKGFVSAVLLAFAIGVGVRVVEWVNTNQFPQALIEILTEPMFSVADLALMVLFLLIAYAVVWMLAFGPRMR